MRLEAWIYVGSHLTLAAAWSALGQWLDWGWLGTWLWIVLVAIALDGALHQLARAWSRW